MIDSKIRFTKLRWKNLLSYGNYWTEINLDQGEIIVISGKNGEGKSTIMDAFYFALTGKPYRSVNSGSLINSTNRKKFEVELYFEKNNDVYIVRRGLSPNYFNIYKNNEKIPVDGKRITYHQNKLEKITGLTPNIIKNTLLINSALKSFFKLSKNEKRDFINDIFPNLNVFGKMLKIEKNKFDEISAKHSENLHKRDVINKSIEHQKEQLKQYNDIIKKLTKEKERDKEHIEHNIAEYSNLLEMYRKNLLDAKDKEDILINKMNDINKSITELLSVIDSKIDKQNKANDKKNYLSSQIKIAKTDFNDIKNQEITDVCQTCKQKLPENKILMLKNKKEKLLSKAQKQIDSLKLELKIFNKNNKPINTNSETRDIKKYEQKLIPLDQTITHLRKYINTIEKDIFSTSKLMNKSESELKAFEIKLPERPNIDILKTKNELNILNDEISKQKEILKYLKVVNKILLDGELKAFIISNYIPFINEQFNYYLETFNMNVKVRFDSDFEWTILTRKYKNYQFENFSTGEKMRLNLALMFTFIQLAKIISFGSLKLIFNVLAIDEFLDNGMDKDGIEDCLTMINNKNKAEKITIFIISHKFDSASTDFKVIHAVKDHEFSKLKAD